jgi:hypothetical protein
VASSGNSAVKVLVGKLGGFRITDFIIILHNFVFFFFWLNSEPHTYSPTCAMIQPIILHNLRKCYVLLYESNSIGYVS